MMIRGYADHAAFDMIVVTILGILKDQTQLENKALDTAYECAVLAATSSFVSSFDLNGIVEKVLEGVALPKEETTKKPKVPTK